MLRQGSVVRALVNDPRGGNPKLRPLVVLSPTRDIADNRPLVAVAITSQFSDPLAADEVALPYHPGGRSGSGLTRPCVAKCSWLVVLRLGDVQAQKGYLSTERLAAILTAVEQLDARNARDGGAAG
jgi:mRNA-degrading endonuclease toxin of MazEF toxin-antitoxin module